MFNLISSAFGSVTSWIIAGLVAVIVGLNGYIYILKSDAQVEQVERKGIEQAFAFQSSLIEANRASYETNLKSANAAALKVKVEYKTKVKIIEKWRDSNATCNDALGYLNTYNF